MFRRKDRDEEYIAPSVEYRDECDEVEHGQTYENYDRYTPRNEDYRRDCDHDHEQSYANYDRYAPRDYDYRSSNAERYSSVNEDYTADCGDRYHGQTYEDYNSEQSGYDAGSQERYEVERALQSGEVLLWCEHQRKDSTKKERRKSNLGIIFYLIALGIILYGIAGMMDFGEIFGGIILLMVKMPIVGFFLFLGWLVSKNYPATFAITDRRVLFLHSGGVQSASLEKVNVAGIRSYSSHRNVGWVYVPANGMDSYASEASGRKLSAVLDTFAGISDPKKVETILRDAIKADMIRKREKRQQNKQKMSAKAEEIAKLKEEYLADKAARK